MGIFFLRASLQKSSAGKISLEKSFSKLQELKEQRLSLGSQEQLSKIAFSHFSSF